MFKTDLYNNFTSKNYPFTLRLVSQTN